MTRFDVHAQNGYALLGMVTDGTALAVLDRTTGTLTIGETDEDGQFLPDGMQGMIGYDPLAPVPVLVVSADDGTEIHRAEVVEVGESDPSTVVMPDEPGD